MERNIEIASRMREERYPDSYVVFLAGSLMRAEGTSYSDLDIVVIYDALDKAYRESFLFEGIMIETFVHAPEIIDYFLTNIDGPEGNPTLALMVAEGVEIPSANPLSQDLKRKANEGIAEGPGACGVQQTMNMRYAITNLVDDLSVSAMDRSFADVDALLQSKEALILYHSVLRAIEVSPRA